MEINYIAVLIAAVASNIIGATWYSPRFFGTAWMKLLGWDPHNQAQMAQMKKNAGRSYAINAFVSIIMAYVLAHFVLLTISWGDNQSSIISGIKTGFWIWLGFIVPVTLGSVLWENKSWKLFLINTSYYLVTLILMGTILGAWK